MKKQHDQVSAHFAKLIETRLGELGVSAYRAAMDNGMSAEAIKRIVKGEIQPSLPRTFEICEALGIPFSIGTPETPNRSADYDDWVMIPQSDVAFSAGHGAAPPDDESAIKGRAFNRQWLESQGFDVQRLELVCIKGDSMMPDLRSGDVAMIDRQVSTPITTQPIAFRLQGNLFIKRCQPTGDGRLKMISSNPQYDPIIINPTSAPSDFQVLGAVVWGTHVWV